MRYELIGLSLQLYIKTSRLSVAPHRDYVYIIQEPGEIVMTLYDAYHLGFNPGLNVCESSNLASEKYDKQFSQAKICNPKLCNTE